ncbi:MAG: hypothetical protein IT204_05125 [Fimbriimonadaceae bacterium]|nr:hypothetical protein [Fimbriimonadaceae bacterium]
MTLAWLLTCCLAPGGVVVSPAGASFAEQLAAREVVRYVYLCTGARLSLAPRATPGGVTVRVGRAPASEAVPPQGTLLRARRHGQHLQLDLLGGDEAAVLYAAYRLAERLGARFGLHGDTLPDQPAAWPPAPFVERRQPLFEVRGIQPFHDFPEGPDWWDLDDYRAVGGQLPKLGMNFLGLHNYPPGGVGPELAVWHGLATDLAPDGAVRWAYPASWHNTQRGNWGYQARSTGHWAHGAAELFATEAAGPEVMGPHLPRPATVEAAAEVYNAAGRMLATAFAAARQRGVRICVGTETPLHWPAELTARLRQQGLDPADPATRQRVYEGTFERLKRLGGVDWYWLWTPENWTWDGNQPAQSAATLADLRTAWAALQAVGQPFGLATCGWVLGPQEDRALFHRELPGAMPFAAINRNVGNTAVDPAFSRLGQRPRWAIPWLEDDPGLLTAQLWAGRMRQDATDALRYGCTGLLGIHWRTRVLAPNIAALAAAGWEQSWQGTVPPKLLGAVGGRVAHFPPADVADTDLDPLYRDVRYDVSAYRLPVPNGRYRVVLRFVEPHYGEANKRVFGVRLEGRQVLQGLDLFARLGQDRALDCVYDEVNVADGWFDLEFTREVEFPCLAAFEVHGPGLTRRINCGGPAWGEFEADLPVVADTGRYAPVGDFYADWCRAEFGPVVGPAAAAIFGRLDGDFPRVSTWLDGPGGLGPDGRPWEQVASEFAFVEQFAALRPQIRGAGERERFDYWLETFRCARAQALLRCRWHELSAAVEAAERGAAAARPTLLPAALERRRAVLAALAEVSGSLLATVSTPGELGSVMNFECHTVPRLLPPLDQRLAKLGLTDLPGQPTDYAGPPRVVVTTLRGSVAPGERLRLPVRVLAPRSVTVSAAVRALGEPRWRPLPATHRGRGVWQVELPPARGLALEWMVAARLPDGRVLHFPATAPQRGQSVVVEPVAEGVRPAARNWTR